MTPETRSRANRSRGEGSSGKKIRYAVVGLGYISQIAVLPAFQHARENSELAALVSDDPEKLKALSEKYGVERTYSYDNYSECLQSGEIDAVYIALPNAMHRQYSEAAAEAGVHILCEKPMAMNEEDCRAMIAAAEKSGVKLMIAYRLHFEPGNLRAIELISSGKIGEPRIFTSVFSQQVKPGNSRLSGSLAGGALYDMGTYCINAARYLFRAEPNEVFAWNLNSGDPRFREVPEMTSGIMKFPRDRVASFTTSFGATDRSVFEVIGTDGVLKMDPAYEMAEPLKLELIVGEKMDRRRFSKRDQFAPELVYFSKCILENQEPEPSGYEGLADVAVIQALLESARTGQPSSVTPVKIRRRPEPSQEISKSPVRPPELVRAASPGAE